MFFNSLFWSTLHIFRWRDLVEIIILGTLFYYFCLWLKQDSQKPLLLTFYSYLSILTVAHFAHLPTLLFLLISCFPVLLVCFIIIHQSTLQKNFIALHAISPKTTAAHRNYEELIIQSLLIAASDGKSVSCIIEKKNTLISFLHTQYLFNAPLSQTLLDALLESTAFDQTKLLWFNTQALLIGMNCEWTKSSVEEWLTTPQEHPQWLQDALFYTTKTDCLFLRIDAKTRTFTCIADGVCIDQLAAHQAVTLLKKQLYSSFSTKGDHHDQKPSSPSFKHQSFS